MKRQLTILFIFGLLATRLFAQSEKKMVREGNNQFEDGNYSEAEIEYRKALSEKPGYFKGTFNLGDAMYQQENFGESGKLFTEAAEGAQVAEAKAGAFYNLGNSLMKEQKYKESIEAYKNSLRLKPDDPDAKYNLAYAQKKLKEQQQKQQQNQDKNKDKEQNKDKNKDQNKDKNKDQNKDQDKKQDQDKKDKDKQDNSDQGDRKKDENRQQQPQQISKADAQRMLEALKNDEKKTLQKLQKEKAKAAKSKKTEIDW